MLKLKTLPARLINTKPEKPIDRALDSDEERIKLMYESIEEEVVLPENYKDELNYDPLHAKNNPMYNQTRYQSVKEFAEVTSNENYRKWKASYEESIINQAGNERGVQHRKELLKTIKEKVNPNDSTYF